MKKIMFPLAFLIFLTVLFTGSAFAAVKWKIKLSSPYNTNAVYIAGFYDLTNGITAGYAGEVHYTSDGGKSWPNGVNVSACRFGLEILDPNNAWTSGNNGNVRVSHDSGVTWVEAADFGNFEPNECRYLSFIDPESGWIASQSRLAVTYDGAKSWTEITLPPQIKNIMAIHMLSKDQGFLFTLSGDLFITKDGCKTWDSHKIDFKGRQLLIMVPTAPKAALRFTDESKGTLITAILEQKQKWMILQTADGGKTWKEESLPAQLNNINVGTVFLSRDASVLTVHDKLNKVIYVLKKI